MRSLRRPRWAVFILALVILAAAGAWPQDADKTSPQTQAVNLFAIGDWGMPTTHGVNNRAKVANAMADYAAATQPFDASLMLGDNFYVDLQDVNDPTIKEFFEDTYDAKRLNFPFYVLPGNHDYLKLEGHELKVQIELEYAKAHPESRFKMPARWYRVDFPAGAEKPMLTVLMLDSDKETMGLNAWRAELRWLDGELAKPRGLWTMCCAHHPLFSNGNHLDNGVLQRDWGARFENNKIDFYLCGHDHTMQHLELPDWHASFVVSGGGSGSLLPMLKDNRGPFSRSTFGFATLQFTAELATVRLFDSNGALMHEFTRDRDGHVNVTFNTASDKATTHPLRVINEIPDASSD